MSVMAEEQETPVWPWKYVPLDKEALLDLCYKKFYEYGGCGGGCCGGIIDIFSEVTGYPYNEMTPGRVILSDAEYADMIAKIKAAL